MKLSKIYNLKFMFPVVSRQWHPFKNGKLDPEQVTPGSDKKVWWKCEKGHEWQTNISARTRSNGSGCPYCSGKRANHDYNLQVINPGVARQWHPFKNGKLNPEQVTPGSGKKVWWKCEKGHEWQANINARTMSNRTGCPYCSGKRASHDYNLQVINPGVARQWHPFKNGKLDPEQVTPGSGKKVWWKCEKGHEWQNYICARTKSNGSGCPYCSGRKASHDYNLQVINPAAARQWHPTRNGNLKPEQVTPRSKKKVWWICEKGHEWEAIVYYRNIGHGCLYCCGKKVAPERSLFALYPGLAKEWHPFKNGKLDPEQVTPGSDKKVWWKCEKGHEWQTYINARARSNGSGCPYCSGRRASHDYNLQVINPGVARQWHPFKNGKLDPEQVTPGSPKKAWWICEKGHEWRTAVKDRNKGASCPYCTGRRLIKEKSLLAVNPELANQWHPTKNGDLSPGNFATKSNKKVWWRCKKGHEWQATIVSRFKGSNCPYCVGKRASKEYNFGNANPVLIKEWHPTKNGKLTPFDVTPHSSKKVWWLCKNGHEWQAVITTRNGSPGCHFCLNPGYLKKHFEPRVHYNKNYPCVVTTLDEKKKIKVGNKTYFRNRIVPYARYIYGLENIPPGYIIWHTDGDPVNNDLDNLECISRSEAMKRMISSGIL